MTAAAAIPSHQDLALLALEDQREPEASRDMEKTSAALKLLKQIEAYDDADEVNGSHAIHPGKTIFANIQFYSVHVMEYEFEAPVKLLDKMLHSMPQSLDWRSENYNKLAMQWKEFNELCQVKVPSFRVQSRHDNKEKVETRRRVVVTCLHHTYEG
ncbi:hypothetical protein ACFXTH_024109 [Malus domestica]